MRVLFVYDYAYPYVGGAEMLIKCLTEGLAARGHHVTIVTSRYRTDLARDETINGVRYIRLFTVNMLSPRFSLFFTCFPYLLRHIRTYDVVQTFPYIVTFPVWLATRLTGTPGVITVFEVLGRMWTKNRSRTAILYRIMRLHERIVLNLRFDRVIAISRYTHNCLRIFTRHPDTRLRRIYCGIDYEHWDADKYSHESTEAIRRCHDLTTKWVYLFFGRPGITKGIEVMMQAVKQVAGRMPEAKAVLLVSHSESYEIEHLKSYIATHDLERNVVLVDSVPYDALPSHLLMADCVVIPSLTEGFGYSAAEACALGRPVVVSDAASLPEVVHGKVKLFRVGDADDLARAILDVHRGNFDVIPEKTFSIEALIDAYEAVYQDLRA